MLVFDLIIWGLLAGFLASKLFSKTREPIALDLAFFGVAVAIAGIIYYAFGIPGLTMYTVLSAAAGTILMLAGFRAVPERLPVKTKGWKNMLGPGTLTSRWGRVRQSRVADELSVDQWESEGGAPVPPEVSSTRKA